MTKDRVITTDQERAEWGKREQKELHQRKADLQAVMATSAGRRLIYGLLENAGVGLLPKDPYRHTPGAGTDTAATFQELGRQSFGRGMVHDLVAICPDAYELMLREHLGEIVAAAREQDKKDRKPATEDTDQ